MGRRRGERRRHVAGNNNREERGRSAEWADDNNKRKKKMISNLSSAVESVDAKLELAEDLARRRFENPSDDAVLAIFHRLCFEADTTSVPLRVQQISSTVH